MFANDDFNSFNVLPNNPIDFTAPVDSSVIVLNIPTFLIPANSPAPIPIVPNEPKLPVILSITERRLFNPFTAEIIASEFAICPMVFVHVLERRLRLPYFIQQSSLCFASYNYNKSVD